MNAVFVFLGGIALFIFCIWLIVVAWVVISRRVYLDKDTNKKDKQSTSQ